VAPKKQDKMLPEKRTYYEIMQAQQADNEEAQFKEPSNDKRAKYASGGQPEEELPSVTIKSHVN
jgi:hypothetical protein